MDLINDEVLGGNGFQSIATVAQDHVESQNDDLDEYGPEDDGRSDQAADRPFHGDGYSDDSEMPLGPVATPLGVLGKRKAKARPLSRTSEDGEMEEARKALEEAARFRSEAAKKQRDEEDARRKKEEALRNEDRRLLEEDRQRAIAEAAQQKIQLDGLMQVQQAGNVAQAAAASAQAASSATMTTTLREINESTRETASAMREFANSMRESARTQGQLNAALLEYLKKDDKK